MSQVAERPLRADARRNHERVLAAARAVFGEHGREAQMDDVARRAGVGVGTVYRHFPTKQALIAALVVDAFERIAEESLRALEEPDAWEGLTRVLWYAGETLAGDRSLSEAMAAEVEIPGGTSPGQLTLERSMAELMARAQKSGQMRPDAVIEDISMLMCGLGMSRVKPHPSPQPWRRHLAILIDGLRASSAVAKLPD